MKGRSCVYCGKAGIIVATYCLCIVFLKYTPGFISHGPFINLKRNSCLNRSNLPFLSFYFFFFFLFFSFFFFCTKAVLKFDALLIDLVLAKSPLSA